jgi:subtilisin family serine protease
LLKNNCPVQCRYKLFPLEGAVKREIIKILHSPFIVLVLFLFIGINTIEANDIVSAQLDSKKQNINNFIGRLLAAEHIESELVVKFKDEIAVNDAAMKAASSIAHSKTGASVKKEFKKIKGLQLIKLPKYRSVREALESYLQDSQIEYAEPNYIVRAATTPNDTYFNSLWGLHNTGQTGGTNDADIDAPEAWNLTTGSSNVVIAVIDSGVAYNHPDLQSNIWSNPGETSCTDGIDNDGNGYIDDCNGWDFIGDDNNPTDFNGHGTHVAGTIAAVGNNNQGITGVMWQAKIMPLRFLGVSGSGTTADAVSAILYASANGAHVINNSWGGGGYSQALKDVIDASNAVVVCAAGNDGTNNDTIPFYPASYTSPNIIAVAAADHNDTLAYFSNYGAISVDIGAPGVSIYSTIPNFTYGPPVTVYSQNFDGASGNLPLLGWNRGGAKATWAMTSGTGVGGTNSLEDSPGGNYVDNTNSWAGYMNPIASVKDNRYTLSFRWRGNLENNYDYLDINYSDDGVNWYWIDYRTGTTLGNFISDSTGEFTAIADTLNSFYFGFGLESDYSITYDGVYLDDVVLTREPITITIYNYTNYQGTSMAAPHVSGVAGLIKALNPGLTNSEIKNAILNNVDAKASLTGKVATGGRINAYKALNSVLIPDIKATPSSINFGSVNIGNSLDSTVTVSNIGTGNLTVSSVTLPSQPFSIATDNCTGVTLAPPTTCKIIVRFKPTEGITYTSNFHIFSNDPDTPDISIALNGTGVTIQPVDLIISSLIVPLSGTPGSTITVKDTTKNNGPSTAVPSTTKFYWSTNTTYDAGDSELGSRAIPSLIAGAKSPATGSASTSVTLPAGTCTGAYYIIAMADADNVVPETNETNNTKNKPIKIGADLIVSALTAPLTAVPGQIISVNDTTKNRGGCPAGASTTKFYLSTNRAYDAGDSELGSRAIPSLAAGAKSPATGSASTSVTIPAGITSGTYYIISRADADGVVSEANESNNNKSKSITISP